MDISRVKGPGLDQVFDGFSWQAGALYDVSQASKGAVPFSRLNDSRCSRLSHGIQAEEPQQQAFVFYDTKVPAVIDVRVQNFEVLPPSVLLEVLQVVEAHGLLVEYPHEQFRGVVVFQPGHVVSGDPKGKGVGLGEHVVAVELLEYPVCYFFAGAFAPGALPELPVEFLKLRQTLPSVEGGEGPAHLVPRPRLIVTRNRCPLYLHDLLRLQPEGIISFSNAYDLDQIRQALLDVAASKRVYIGPPALETGLTAREYDRVVTSDAAGHKGQYGLD